MSAMYVEEDIEEYLSTPEELYRIVDMINIPREIVTEMSETIMADYLRAQIDPRLGLIPAITFDNLTMYCGMFDTRYIYATGSSGKLFFKANDILSHKAN